MPRQKDLKRLVRTRMKKTGEAYTAARAQIVKKATRSQPAASRAPTLEYANLAGISDAAVQAKTGCTWERWVRTLDYHRAYELQHREIARLVQEKYNATGWWAQTVTVGYERIKGLRERGQRRGGRFEANKSRTFNVPVGTLFEAWKSPARRKRFLPGAVVRVRSAAAPKSLRLEMEDGTVATLWFTRKSDSRSSVAVQHLNLPDRESTERSREFWSERLDALAAELGRQVAR